MSLESRINIFTTQRWIIDLCSTQDIGFLLNGEHRTIEDSNEKKNKLDLYLISCTKICSALIIILNVKGKIIKFFEESKIMRP